CARAYYSNYVGYWYFDVW
nr:immunoglobulin heavy chain junction region [Mus musculus]NSM03789.1 immunoglobulin heavy chain junction region [Mus musculus]NSM04118.1 immunoglobulin heavy chain junction region [Mus musculus]NSM04330.1 immunoglobulin heavy chain junction region [Mus musculus]NSM04453.1 immunoglobulin heavy chain junction region [Mus musculus]